MAELEVKLKPCKICGGEAVLCTEIEALLFLAMFGAKNVEIGLAIFCLHRKKAVNPQPLNAGKCAARSSCGLTRWESG